MMDKVYTTFGIVSILVAAFAASNAIKGHAALAVSAEEIKLKNLVQAHKVYKQWKCHRCNR
jgi:hypothetical protein